MEQIIKHMDHNKLIPHHHHGGILHHGTTTALATIIDNWSTKMEQGIDAAALIMDQSLAFDLVYHPILVQKLKALGLDHHSVKLMQSYLNNRQQSVHLEGYTSPPLHTGPVSVIQGSSMSSLLFIIYTLDLPYIFYDDKLSIQQEEASTRPKSILYIDDNVIHITPFQTYNLQQAVDWTISKVHNYMNANKLKLNKDKTKIMVLSKNPATRNSIKIVTPDNQDDILHSSKLKILGIEIEETLNWKYYLTDGPQSILKQIKTRLNSLKLLKRYSTIPQMKQFANGILLSKLEYGAAIWASAPQYILKQLQSCQLEAARTILGPKTRRWTSSHLLSELKWIPIKKIGELASAKLTYQILNTSKPAVLANRMLSKINSTRITRQNGPFQLGPRPPGLGRTRNTKYQYRPNSYDIYQQIPLVLKQIPKPKLFKKRLKRYYLNNDDLPQNRDPTPTTTSQNHPTDLNNHPTAQNHPRTPPITTTTQPQTTTNLQPTTGQTTTHHQPSPHNGK